MPNKKVKLSGVARKLLDTPILSPCTATRRRSPPVAATTTEGIPPSALFTIHCSAPQFQLANCSRGASFLNLLAEVRGMAAILKEISEAGQITKDHKRVSGYASHRGD